MKQRGKVILAIVAAVALTAAIPMLASAAGVPRATMQQAGEQHRVVVQVDSASPEKMNEALSNIQNILRYYHDNHGHVQIELVANGPGLDMLRQDKSPVAERIHEIKTSNPSVIFSGCANTRAWMEENEGRPIPILADARIVPSGAVRVVELQEKGWAYLKP